MGPDPSQRKKSKNLTNCDILEFVKWDAASDISDDLAPLCALNYLWVTARMMVCLPTLLLSMTDKCS